MACLFLCTRIFSTFAVAIEEVSRRPSDIDAHGARHQQERPRRQRKSASEAHLERRQRYHRRQAPLPSTEGGDDETATLLTNASPDPFSGGVWGGPKKHKNYVTESANLQEHVGRHEGLLGLEEFLDASD